MLNRMSVAEAFGDVANSFAQLAPEKIIKLKASSSMSMRVELLIERKKNDQLTADEAIELERFLALDLFVSLTKARARILLSE